MKRTSCIIALVVILLSRAALADLINGVYYNPGIKFGYQFGKKGGFILCFENSIVGAFQYGWPFLGMVGGAGVNFNKRNFVGYWEIEAGFSPGGFAIGGEWNRGYYSTIRFFGGALAFLSYKYVFRKDVHELSLVNKVPIFVYTRMDHGTYTLGDY